MESWECMHLMEFAGQHRQDYFQALSLAEGSQDGWLQVEKFVE